MKDDHQREQLIINPEVSEMVLKQLDFGRQKICRLICKSLNQEFCRLVGVKGVAVYLGEDDDTKQITAFKETYKKGRLFPKLPSPFKNTNLSIRLSAPATLEALHSYHLLLQECPELTVTELEVGCGIGGKEVASPKEHLELIALDLIELKSTYWTSFAGDFSKIRLPKLKKLSIIALDPTFFHYQDYVVEEDWKTKELHFWSSIINLAPSLQHLECRGLKLLQALFQLCDLNGVKTLAVENSFNERIQACLLHVIMTEFIPLTDLSFRFDMSDSATRHAINVVIARSSTSLQSVRLVYRGAESWDIFPYCASLLSLTLSAVDVERFPWGNVPMLRSICAQRMVASGNGEALEELLFTPCLSVQHVRLDGRSDYANISARLFQAFPNATSWDINVTLLPGFCERARASGAYIRRLGLKPTFTPEPPHTTLQLDLTPCLKQLPHLLELDVDNNTKNLQSPLSIDLSELPNIRILTWMGPHHESKSSFKKLPAHLSSLARFEFDQVSQETFDADVEEFVTALPTAVWTRKHYDDQIELMSCYGHYG